jgi:aspartyl-tRNA(Asn)/glutamyl-tRNA(Gln) amidotransferase subunit C
MVTPEEVKKLAALARISVSDEELPRFVKEFEGILAYVGQLEKLQIDVKGTKATPALRNVMRDDGEPHAKGEWTQILAEQFPAREGDALSVKQIISHD